MLQLSEIPALLEKLDDHIADDLEGQELDFKEWKGLIKDMIRVLVKAVISFSNAGEGLVIVGVKERVVGRSEAIKGVPQDIDILQLQRSIYDNTEPHITVRINEVAVEYGTGRILVIQVFPGMPPYTTSEGTGCIRVGKDSVPLTGSKQREMMESMGYHDVTSSYISERWQEAYSPIAMECLREMMAREAAPEDMRLLSDQDLLQNIGALREGKLTIAGLLMAGKSQLIEKYVPCYRWAFRKMVTDTEYSLRAEGNDAIPVALREIERYIEADNPITTIELGFLHSEVKKYPLIAIRESIMNAFVHRDYRIPGAVMVRLADEELVVSNPGELIGGITPDNILHHAPVSRNNALASILEKLRLVNRSNLGVPRIYSAMLSEGKEAPIYEIGGSNVTVSMRGSVVVPSIRKLVHSFSEQGIRMEVDYLIILNYLLKHREITAQIAAEICQRSTQRISETLNKLDVDFGVLTPAGKGRGRYYMLSQKTHALLAEDVRYSRNERIDHARLKVQILTMLKEAPLSNQEIRQLSGMSAQQVRNYMSKMVEDGVELQGKGRAAKYILKKS